MWQIHDGSYCHSWYILCKSPCLLHITTMPGTPTSLPPRRSPPEARRCVLLLPLVGTNQMLRATARSKTRTSSRRPQRSATTTRTWPTLQQSCLLRLDAPPEARRSKTTAANQRMLRSATILLLSSSTQRFHHFKNEDFPTSMSG